MLRRTKVELIQKGVIKNLPDKHVEIIEINLDKDERVVYHKLLLYAQGFFNEFLMRQKDEEHLQGFTFHSRPSRGLLSQGNHF